MRKIPTLFIREMQDGKFLATPKVDPECVWVLYGEGIATEKIDGSCCLVHNGAPYRRHRVKDGRKPPPGWLHWSFDPDQESGHGWVEVTSHAADQYHLEAWTKMPSTDIVEGATYELVGPALQSNPYGYSEHRLIRHGVTLLGAPRSFAMLLPYLATVKADIEGIVWWHPDGRMAKLKRKDFGLPWPVPKGSGNG